MTDNELISEFMGRHTKRYAMSDEELSMSLQDIIRSTSYNSSWNCLMPVVLEISKYRLAYPKEVSKVCDCKIVIEFDHLYSKVIEFIKWYAVQRPKKP